MSGRVLHFGKYDGCEIDRVVEIDPEYIIWAVDNVKGHGISQRALNRAMDLMDEDDSEDNHERFDYGGFDDDVGDR